MHPGYIRFSLQNRINTKLRNRLGQERANRLMTMNLGPSIDNFCFTNAVRYWRAAKKRKLCALYRPGHTSAKKNQNYKPLIHIRQTWPSTSRHRGYSRRIAYGCLIDNSSVCY